ncbi:uncharacterized protein LOC17899129 [Capsella rubella]|uniref:uncharacterized protein LOC17899129 n=1 Tax=Capsella rubella TaxID=81985 RepID=UPI000CD4A0E5|nr:uncharacterized protein LOC17899129 [Capsella rubella]
MSMTDHVRVLRHNKRLPQFRYCPYTIRSKEKEMEKQKEEARRLGIELSFLVAEAMFLLSDDILFRVIQHVFVFYIKPKKGVYKDAGQSIQWEHLKACAYYFAYGVRVLVTIVSVLEGGCLVKQSAFKDYNQEVKKLEENLRSVKDVIEANGFSREAIESRVLYFWKSLFVTSSTVLVLPDKPTVHMLFRDLLNEASRDACSRLLTSLHI